MDADDVRPADDTEVRAYVAAARPHTLVVLMAGPTRDQADEHAAQIQQGHLRHLIGLQRSGDLVVNGPVLDETSPVRGISVYRTDDLDMVRAWVDADPAMATGRLTARVLPWLGLLPGDDSPPADEGERR